jgi:hypothetical protein
MPETGARYQPLVPRIAEGLKSIAEGFKKRRRRF